MVFVALSKYIFVGLMEILISHVRGRAGEKMIGWCRMVLQLFPFVGQPPHGRPVRRLSMLLFHKGVT